MPSLHTLDEIEAAIEADEADLAQYRADARRRMASGKDPGHARAMVGVMEHRLGVLRERHRDKEQEARDREGRGGLTGVVSRG